jgi:hypothetical protein
MAAKDMNEQPGAAGVTNKRLCFSLMVCAMSLTISSAGAAEIACGSLAGEFAHCSLVDATQRKVKLKQRIEGVCQFGQSWGVDSDGVWVDMGCRAIFKYAAAAPQKAGWRRFLPRWPR